MPDHHDDLDERMARLQRLAYGADASDDTRAAARSELAALRGRGTAADDGLPPAGREPGTEADPAAGADDDAPIEWTRAWQVFDRRPGDGDLVRHPPPDAEVELDDSSRRLLVTRSDGLRLVAARTADGGNACLILVLPVGRPGIACTEFGRFPADGLRAEVSAPAVGEYVAIWNADGRVTVNAAAVPSG